MYISVKIKQSYNGFFSFSLSASAVSVFPVPGGPYNIRIVDVFPDHDTFESIVLNHNETKFWDEQQIRKSGNFCENSWIFTELHGGINYQIHHHLFPTVSHRYYTRLTPLIKEHCAKYNIPYNSKSTLYSVLCSYLKMIRYMKLK